MKSKLLKYFLVLGLFVAAAFLVFAEFKLAAGTVLVVVGIMAIAFSRSMAEAQKQIAKSRYGLKHWGSVTPLTFGLWGVGIVIIGLAWLFVW